METNTFQPILIAPQTAVLLVFVSVGRPGRGTVEPLLQTVRAQVGGSLRILTIDEAGHPEVIRSFSVTKLPTFVLVQQGSEIWRYEGLPVGAELVPALLAQLQRLH